MNVKVQDPTFELALVSPFLLQTLAEVVQNKGVDPQSLCRGLGFTLEDLQDPTQRISYRQAVAMIQRALKVLPNQGLGLWVGAQNVLGTLGLLGHVLSLCKTLRDAFALGIRHQHTSGGIVVSSVDVVGGRCISMLNAACRSLMCRCSQSRSFSPVCWCTAARWQGLSSRRLPWSSCTPRRII
jgi:hypothetical protein